MNGDVGVSGMGKENGNKQTRREHQSECCGYEERQRRLMLSLSLRPPVVPPWIGDVAIIDLSQASPLAPPDQCEGLLQLLVYAFTDSISKAASTCICNVNTNLSWEFDHPIWTIFYHKVFL